MIKNFYKQFYDIERWLFYLIMVTMPIQSLPKRYTIPKFMKNVPQCILIVAFILCILYFVHNRKSDEIISKWWKIYFSFCIIWPILCTVIGIFVFPYWDMATDEYLRNTWLIQQLAKVYPGIVDNTFLLHLKYGQFLVRSTISEFLFPLMGIPFIFWVAFKKKGNTYILQTVSKMALIVSSILAVYSLIETAWLLTDNQFLADVLKTLYTFIWDPGYDKDHWWPKLLWPGRLRSIYGEPGHFGVMAMFVIPFLWYRMLELKKRGTGVLLIFFTFMVFMTHSRTALAVFGGELLILLLLSIISRYPEWRKYIIHIFVLTLLSFGLYVIVPLGTSYFSARPQSQMQIEKFQSDMDSIISKNQRSNGARLGNIVAKINVAKQHLLFGVGTNLESRYMIDNIPEFAKDNWEIKSWSKLAVEELGGGFAALNEFALVFVEYGLIGLFLYLLPIGYLFIKVIRYRNVLLINFGIVCILTSVFGQIACQLGTGLWLTYPAAMSIAFCVISNEMKRPLPDKNATMLKE